MTKNKAKKTPKEYKKDFAAAFDILLLEAYKEGFAAALDSLKEANNTVQKKEN